MIPDDPPAPTGLNHLTLAVADLDRAFDFYVGTLGCVPRARWARGAYLSCGSLWLCLSLDPDGHRLELHAGSLESRFAAVRETPYEGMVTFDPAP